MSIQMIDGRIGYVVEFDDLPKLPIIGHFLEKPYAEALTDAIQNNVITEGGKYFITFTQQYGIYAKYDVLKVIE